MASIQRGNFVQLHSLKTIALNGLVGQAVGRQGDRIQVKFFDGKGNAFKPTNLQILEPEEVLLRFLRACDGMPHESLQQAFEELMSCP